MIDKWSQKIFMHFSVVFTISSAFESVNSKCLPSFFGPPTVVVLIEWTLDQKLSNFRTHFLKAHWFYEKIVTVKDFYIFHKILSVLFFVFKMEQKLKSYITTLILVIFDQFLCLSRKFLELRKI